MHMNNVLTIIYFQCMYLDTQVHVLLCVYNFGMQGQRMPMIKLDGNLKLFYCPYLVCRKYATLHVKQYEFSSKEHSYFCTIEFSHDFSLKSVLSIATYAMVGIWKIQLQSKFPFCFNCVNLLLKICKILMSLLFRFHTLFIALAITIYQISL